MDVDSASGGTCSWADASPERRSLLAESGLQIANRSTPGRSLLVRNLGVLASESMSLERLGSMCFDLITFEHATPPSESALPE